MLVYPQIDPVALAIGPLKIHWYGLMYLLGFGVAWWLGRVDMAALPQVPLISVPVPFKYGFSFDWVAFIPVAVIFLISPLEAAGDLTANSMISQQPVKGPLYIKRIKSGLLADGLNSAMAATHCFTNAKVGTITTDCRLCRWASSMAANPTRVLPAPVTA